MAIHARGVVARRKFRAPRRGRRIVLASTTCHRLAPARFGRLQQGETKIPVDRGNFLGLPRQRRNPEPAKADCIARFVGVPSGVPRRNLGPGQARRPAPTLNIVCDKMFERSCHNNKEAAIIMRADSTIRNQLGAVNVKIPGIPVPVSTKKQG